MSAILFCLFGSTQTLASQLQIARPRWFQRPSFLRPTPNGLTHDFNQELEIIKLFPFLGKTGLGKVFGNVPVSRLLG